MQWGEVSFQTCINEKLQISRNKPQKYYLAVASFQAHIKQRYFYLKTTNKND